MRFASGLARASIVTAVAFASCTFWRKAPSDDVSEVGEIEIDRRVLVRVAGMTMGAELNTGARPQLDAPLNAPLCRCVPLFALARRSI
eukprot:5703126-Pleurochrysis_carterae.AAC.1